MPILDLPTVPPEDDVKQDSSCKPFEELLVLLRVEHGHLQNENALLKARLHAHTPRGGEGHEEHFISSAEETNGVSSGRKNISWLPSPALASDCPDRELSESLRCDAGGFIQEELAIGNGSSIALRSLMKANEPTKISLALPVAVVHTRYDIAQEGGSEPLSPVRSPTGTGSKSITAAMTPMTAGHMELKEKYMEIFDHLDSTSGGTGNVSNEVMHNALRAMGLGSRVRKLMKTIDTNGDGIVDREEWELGVEEVLGGSRQSGTAFLDAFMERIDKGMTGEKEEEKEDPLQEYCLISHKSKFRITWDLFLGCLLLHVAIVIPFEIGFLADSGDTGKYSTMSIIGLVIDMFFMIDVTLNFRTTYRDNNGNHISNGLHIALHYIRTWFLIDLISSIPFEHVSSGLLPSLNMTKLAKSGKAFKLLKMLRFAKATRFSERFSDYLAVSGGTLLWGMILVGNAVLMLCHWLACLLPVVGDGFLEAYVHSGTSVSSRYCCAIYWAVTTITTVGYGDVLPTTDAERLYTICAMLVGGGLYSCVIGNVFVILNSRNLNAQASIQRLREVLEFLDYHGLPTQLRQRVWHYHRKYLKGKPVSDKFSVLGDLSPDLRQAVSYIIVHEDVRSNPLFNDVPSIVVLFFASVMKNITGELGDILASHGDYGYAMCVVIEGSTVSHSSDAPIKTYEESMQLAMNPPATQVMLPGDSFGEEILLGITRTYSYSIIACSHVMVAQIPAEEFMMHFQSMPDIMQKMHSNFRANGGSILFST